MKRLFFLLYSCLFVVLSMQSAPIGTPFCPSATKVLFLGAGELGKEVIIALQQLGVQVVAVDRYANAPGMQVAHRSHVISMIDADALRAVIDQEQPDYIVPEIEAIATDVLVACEKEGYTVIPTARATQLTMNRKAIRTLAAQELDLPTSRYRFASDEDAYHQAINEIGLPCVVKPTMSSSGRGQSIVRDPADINKAWQIAAEQGRGAQDGVIVEAFVDFDYEITLLTVRQKDGPTLFCEPIGHKQVNGDYRESWQPHPMLAHVRAQAESIAQRITDALGGHGVFGVELFVKGDQVIFNEVSPRPHDTGMVTMIAQNLSEFQLHARAILGLPIPSIEQYGPAASAAVVHEGVSENMQYDITRALTNQQTEVRLFGKPCLTGTERRLGVTLARAATIDEARRKACQARDAIEIIL